MINGKCQVEEVETVEDPVQTYAKITDTFDNAASSISNFQVAADTRGTFTHKRALLYIKGYCWVVLDRVYHDRQDMDNTLQPLWHFHPDCNVIIDGKNVVSNDEGKGNLRIVPVSELNWDVKLVKGETDDDDKNSYRMWQPDMIKGADEKKIQGWYGNKYNNKIPEYCAIYETKTRKSNTFMWLLIPAKGIVPDVKYEIIALEKDLGHIKFSFGNKAFEVKMNFTGMSEVSALK